MTVSELIEELQGMDPDAEVRFAYNYGDYWRTTVAAEIKYVEDGTVRWSDYHSMDKIVDLNEQEDPELVECDVKDVCVLSATRIY